eukprot:CAMPEP_0119040584 /NCGR_PEP_ID=MMETSP1177-20130426/10583_1 /TAXON_ID=2985 /ORGANISM="Ochromonas sp, Strain CCMP1899" /LENGTH=151 /DNA_ID=CAMNT_0007005811 /DNA_START=511 /DNA_END=966 /DNA_ORIENTATION=+
MYNEDQYDGFQYESRSLVDLKDGTERIKTTDDVAGNSILNSRIKSRDYRLKSTDLEKLKPTNPIFSKLAIPTTNSENYLSKFVTDISVDPGSTDLYKVNRTLPLIAASDFEGTLERQRFLKYDNIWRRAEESFINKKSGVHTIDEEDEDEG